MGEVSKVKVCEGEMSIDELNEEEKAEICESMRNKFVARMSVRLREIIL